VGEKGNKRAGQMVGRRKGERVAGRNRRE